MEKAENANTTYRAVRKWTSFVVSIWIMSISATNFDFPIYSSTLKRVLGINQMMLNNLAVASDLGKLLGWVSGIASLALPNWVVLMIAAFLGLVGYGTQWFLVTGMISKPSYSLIYVACMMAGNSICWLNTVCLRVAISNFPSLKGIAVGLNTSYAGLTAVIYTIISSVINPHDPGLYLFLNAVVPLFFCAMGATVIQIPENELPPKETYDTSNMYIATVIATFTALFSIAYNFIPHDSMKLKLTLLAALGIMLLSLLALPLRCLIILGREKSKISEGNQESSLSICPSRRELLPVRIGNWRNYTDYLNRVDFIERSASRRWRLQSIVSNVSEAQTSINEKKKPSVGEEHTLIELLSSLDFWLYYLVYLCGATVSLVYINNLGQIIQSLGHSKTPTLVSLLSSACFLGKIASGIPDYFKGIKKRVARTSWLGIWTWPMVPTLFAMAYAGEHTTVVYMSAVVMGACSGAITSVAVPTTSELFGRRHFSVNHNILISNIALGSLVMGNFAGFVYDYEIKNNSWSPSMSKNECMGSHCYEKTFVTWACLTFVACILSLLLWFRTRHICDAK